ncbi:MAG: hypothetical protein ABL903_12400 [Methylococcales bacterium]
MIVSITVLVGSIWEIAISPQLDWSKVTISGGCPIETNALLSHNGALKISANTFCGKGNADEATIRITLPGAMLDEVRLMVTGYPGIEGISVTLQGVSASKVISINHPLGELWSQVSATIPEAWKDSLVTVELVDKTQRVWAGIGLAPRAAGSVLQLVVITIGHALIILCPILAGILFAVRLGIRDLTLLLLIGLASGGVLAYIDFWLWLLRPRIGLLAAIGFLLGAIFLSGQWLTKLPAGMIVQLQILAKVALLWFCYALFLLALGLAPTNLDNPLAEVAVRFSSPLPIDNRLPYVLAQQVTAGAIKSPMIDVWLSSDRPPLQTAYFLISGASKLPQSDLHYQVLATLLQSLWVVGMWLLLAVLKPGRQGLFLGLLVPMLSGFAFVHGLFTWPKLFPVVYLAGICALFLRADKNALRDWRIGGLVGVITALAMLCHGGSLFALFGMGLGFIVLKRVPSAYFIVCACIIGALILLTWSIYQQVFDPPGNHILKWHLAGVENIDPRPLWQTVQESYAQLSFEQIVTNKLSNLHVMAGRIVVWFPLTIQAAFGLLNNAEADALRGEQFFHLFATLGLLGVFIPFMAVSALKYPKNGVLRLPLVALAIVFFQIVLLFGPDAAVIHQGSLFLVCLVFSGAMLAVTAYNSTLAWVVAGTHFALTAVIYGCYLPIGKVLKYDQTLWLLVPVSLCCVIGILWKIAGDNRFDLLRNVQ